MDIGAALGIGSLIVCFIIFACVDEQTRKGLASLFVILTILAVMFVAANPGMLTPK